MIQCGRIGRGAAMRGVKSAITASHQEKAARSEVESCAEYTRRCNLWYKGRIFVLGASRKGKFPNRIAFRLAYRGRCVGPPPSFRNPLIVEGHLALFSTGKETSRRGLGEEGKGTRRSRKTVEFAIDDLPGLRWKPNRRRNSANTRNASPSKSARVIAEKSPK